MVSGCSCGLPAGLELTPCCYFPSLLDKLLAVDGIYSSCSGTRLQVSMSDKLQKVLLLHKVVFFLRFPIIHDVITVISIHFQLCRWPGACRFEALRCRCVTLGHQMQSLLQYCNPCTNLLSLCYPCAFFSHSDFEFLDFSELVGSFQFFWILQTFAIVFAEVTLTQPVAVDEVDAEIVVVEGRIIAAWNVPLYCRISFSKSRHSKSQSARIYIIVLDLFCLGAKNDRMLDRNQRALIAPVN